MRDMGVTVLPCCDCAWYTEYRDSIRYARAMCYSMPLGETHKMVHHQISLGSPHNVKCIMHMRWDERERWDNGGTYHLIVAYLLDTAILTLGLYRCEWRWHITIRWYSVTFRFDMRWWDDRWSFNIAILWNVMTYNKESLYEGKQCSIRGTTKQS